MGPTLTPAVNIALVAGLAGDGSWLSFAVATVGMLFVAANIASLSRRHTLSGSYFLYVGHTAGPLAGLVTGWLLVGGYLASAVAIVLAFLVFLRHFLDAIGLIDWHPAPALVTIGLVGGLTIAAWRDVRFSARFALALEAGSLIIITAVTTVAALRTGHLFDGVQLDLARLPVGGLMNSLTFAVLCFVGFESAATLAGETRRPARNVPIAITASTLLAGLFFVAMAYFMVLDFGNDTRAIAASASPLTAVARRAGHAALAGVLYFGALISASACVLATLVAVSRLLFSMARYGAMPSPLAAVDPRRRIPHVALGLSAAIVLGAVLAVLPLGVFEAFGTVAALASLAFVALYLVICVAAPIDLGIAGNLRLRHLLVSAGGILVMAFVAFGSLWPVPPWPQSLLPWLFVAYGLAGTLWFGWLLRLRPGLGPQLQLDLET